MKMTDKQFNESLRFVITHYRPDAFRPARMLFTADGAIKPWFRRRSAVAAAIATALAAAAACGWLAYEHFSADSAPAELPDTVEERMSKIVTRDSVVRLTFTDATLSEVVSEIESTYHVSITNLPDTSERLTLSYEGTADDIVATINDMLGTNLSITQ